MKAERILHIELGAEHGDVIAWMRSLPERTINQTVNEILSSESRGKIRRIPHQFSSTNEQESLSCRLVIRDTAENFVKKGAVRFFVCFAKLAVLVGDTGIFRFLRFGFLYKLTQFRQEQFAVDANRLRWEFLIFSYVLTNDLDQSVFHFALGNFRYEIQSRRVADNQSAT